MEFIAELKGGTTTGRSASSSGKVRPGDIAQVVRGIWGCFGVFFLLLLLLLFYFIAMDVREVISSF